MFFFQFTEAATSASNDDFSDISRLRLKNEDKVASKKAVWPQLPQAIASMVNAFAVSNFAVSIKYSGGSNTKLSRCT